MWGIIIPYCYYIIFNFSLYVSQYLLYVFRCSNFGSIYVNPLLVLIPLCTECPSLSILSNMSTINITPAFL